MALPITFLSDYGHDDEFAGVCRAVMARIAPDARLVDLGHGVARHDVRAGAIALRSSLPFAAPGVHLAVVDPGVGTTRRAVAVRTAEEDRILVGPDNGLLSLAAEHFGGAIAAVDISRSARRLEPASATFHGRDLFAPVAAHLALGEPLDLVGEPIGTDELTTLELPQPTRDPDGTLVAHALLSDRFGNVILDVTHTAIGESGLRLGRPVEIRTASTRHRAQFAMTFADVAPGELLVYEDATRTLAVAVNRGSAADLLGLRPDDELRIAPA